MEFALHAVPLPLRLRLREPMNDDDLMRFCHANDFLSIERDSNGEILVMTPAGGGTGRKNAYLIQSLSNWADADGRGYAFDSDTGFTLPDTAMRSPDAAWVEASRWDALSPRDQERYSPVCPDFLIELRVPSDPLAELQAKMEQWIANGAKLAWLIDPQRKAVTIYRPGQPPEHLDHPASIQGEAPVAGFELPLQRIWS